MPISDNITLFDSLNISIDRIAEGLDQDWLIISQSEFGNSWDQNDVSNCNTLYETALQVESHLFTEVFICLRGSCAIRLENEVYDIDEGHVCLIMPGNPHCELPRKDSDYQAVWLAIDFDMIALHLSGKNDLNGFYTIEGYTSRSTYEYNMVYKNLRKELTEKAGHYREMAKTLLFQILVIISRAVSTAKSNRDGNRLWKESLVFQVQDYISRYYSKNIRLGDISQEVCVSVNYLNNIFKSFTGETIMQYMENFRMGKARQLLVSSNFGIEAIALQLGYCDQYHFSKIFKKCTGFSPSQFRKMGLV